MYVPISQQLSPGELARRDDLYDQLQETETRLNLLEHKKLSVRGPITFMVLGYGGALISGLVALSAFSAAEDIENQQWDQYGSDVDYDFTGNGKVNHADERGFRNMAYGFTAAAAVCLFVGLTSTIRLFSRLSTRKEVHAERASLEGKRARLRQQLDYGIGGTQQQMQFAVRGQY